MGSDFKKQAAGQRVAIPQIDPEATKASTPTPEPESVRMVEVKQKPVEEPERIQSSHVRLTPVITSQAPVNRGFFMYPTRHRQVVRDLVYIEDRKPWQIIEDALEEYVVKHYGKDFRRS
jgi:hypothetical protein